jgi:hypothetical protein
MDMQVSPMVRQRVVTARGAAHPSPNVAPARCSGWHRAHVVVHLGVAPPAVSAGTADQHDSQRFGTCT